MDQSDEAKTQAMVLGRVLEGIGAKLKAEKGLTDEQIGLAMLATGLNSLSRAWTGPELVEHLSGVVGALMEVHGVQPSGEVVARGRPN